MISAETVKFETVKLGRERDQGNKTRLLKDPGC